MRAKRPSRLAIIDHRKKPKKKVAEPFILETKLIPPVPKKNTISRPRLVSLLKKNLNKKLLLITADAGYGKTTLLSQFLHQGYSPGAFYDLDVNDRDLSVFLLHLIEAMGKIQKGLGKRTKNLLSHLENITKNIEMIMGTLINEIVKKRKEDFLIILDDLHTVPQNSSIYRALDYFIEHLPENTHIIISTRAAPPLPSLAKWRTKQDVFELTKEDLRFTEKEIRSLLKNIYKTTLSSKELKELTLHTEGWATGLQMILQHTKAEKIKNTLNNYLESDVPLFDYFANEILKSETEKTRKFLLKSSLLECLSPDACCAISKTENSNEVLIYLVQHNVFTTLVSSRPRIYKYHYLFREFLQHKLGQVISVKELRHLHMNAAKFYINTKNWNRAIHHLVESEAYERTARIIEKIGINLVHTGRVDILFHWIESLPDEVVKNHPWLLLYEAQISQQWGKWNESQALFRKAQRIFQRRGELSGAAEALYNIGNIYSGRGDYTKAMLISKKAMDLIGDRNNRLKAKLLNLLAGVCYRLHDYELMKQKLRKALSLCRRFVYPELKIRVMSNLAMSYYTTGKLQQALEMYRDLFKIKDYHQNLPVAVIGYCNNAEMLMARGAFTAAKFSLDKALDRSKEINFKLGQVCAITSMGNLHQMLAEYDDALVCYNRALVLNRDIQQHFINDMAYTGLAQCYVCKGNLDKAAENIRKSLIPKKGKKDSVDVAQMSLVLGEIALRRGDYETAEKMILRNHKIVLKEGFEYNKMISHLCLANLYWAKGNSLNVKKHLRKGLTIAKHGAYDGLLISEIYKNPGILERAQEENLEPDYLLHIVTKTWLKGYFNVNMLGEFLVKINGHEIPKARWKTERARAILAYFFTEGPKVISREKLMKIFFPGIPPKKSAGNLKTCLYFIRKAAGDHDFLLYVNKGYCINPAVKCLSDVDAFSQRIKIGEQYEKQKRKEEAMKQYMKAVEIYKGDYLEEFYGDWCEEVRKHYQEMYLRTLMILGNYFHIRGKFKRSINCYQKIIEKDRFMEEAYCGIMKCYAKFGNRKEIIAQYKKLTQILKQELGYEPQTETKKLYNQLLR